MLQKQLEPKLSEIKELKETQKQLEAKLSEMDNLKADIEKLKQYFEAITSKE
ncbi:MAG: hypothetical protein GQ564_16805 [Bacteroidales bacterium]|nr:hypothetical protein [Bacteroidales bacterium]